MVKASPGGTNEKGVPPVPEVLEFIELLLAKVDDLPERADDFAIGVEEQTRGILETVNKTKRVTQKQWDALQNMDGGCDRWIERDFDRQ